jgi:hypothetical protein
VTLELAVTAADRAGNAALGLFQPSVDQVTVPAGGTAQVTVSVGAGGTGMLAGRLTATAENVAVQTPLAAVLEPERHDVTVRLIGRDGDPDAGTGQAVNVQTGQVHGIRGFDGNGTAVVRLPPGRYDINAFAIADAEQPPTVTLMSQPGLEVRAAAEVVLDANAGRLVEARVTRPEAVRQYGELGIASADPAGTRTSSFSWTARTGHRLFAVPTRRAVTDHPYAFFLRETLSADDLGAQSAADIYHLAFLERERIPARLTYRPRAADLAVLDTRYHTQGGPARGLRGDYARLDAPGANVALGVFEFHPRPLPSRRVEHYTANPDVTWQQILGVIAADDSDQELIWSVRSHRPGRYRADWNGAPVNPAFGHPADGWGVYRVGDQLSVAVSPMSDSDPDHYSSPPVGLVGTTTLSRDGTVRGTSEVAGFGAFPLAAEPGRYELRMAATRSVPWSVVGQSVDVTWTFNEPGAEAAAAPLPLFLVRARGELDGDGDAPAGRYPLTLTVQRQPDAPAVRTAWLRLAVSTDDGDTWRDVRVNGDGAARTAVVNNPAGGGFVSLRITAGDAGGNTVSQTVIRAYRVAAG